jgi:hypothetical protein
MGNTAKESESMEQADHPSFTLDALPAKKETATRRERQSPDWRSELTNVTFQSQFARAVAFQAQ